MRYNEDDKDWYILSIIEYIRNAYCHSVLQTQKANSDRRMGESQIWSFTFNNHFISSPKRQ